MTSLGAYEAKTRLSQLLDQVAKGEEIIITRHGVPVAALVLFDPRQTDPKAAIKAIKVFRHGRRLAGLSLREMIQEGRF